MNFHFHDYRTGGLQSRIVAGAVHLDPSFPFAFEDLLVNPIDAPEWVLDGRTVALGPESTAGACQFQSHCLREHYNPAY